MRQRPERPELAEEPLLTEVTKALSKLKNGKAPGSSDIVPEMLKVRRGDDKFIGMLWDLIVSPRREGSVPKE